MAARKNKADEPEELPEHVKPLMRTMRDGTRVQSTAPDGTLMYRVRVRDPLTHNQIERHAAGLDRAKDIVKELTDGKRPKAERDKLKFREVCLRYLEVYKTKRDGTERPLSSVRKEVTYLNCYILPTLGDVPIDQIDLPDMYDVIEAMTLLDGSPAAPATKGGAASVVRRVFAWARIRRLIDVNPALELPTGWGNTTRRRVLIPSIPQVMRLAQALDHFKPGLGDVAQVLAFTGMRWEEFVAVLADEVDLDAQQIPIKRTASESGGRRDPREGAKTSAGVRVVVVPDIAMPSVRRLLQRGAQGRELSEGSLYGRLANGDRGGYLSYSVWSTYLRLARGFTAAHPDGAVTYTAHELRHVSASLLIASGASDMQICNQMGHSRVETTKNIYGHLFDQDRTSLLEALNSAVTRLYITDDEGGEGSSVSV
jgi:integrase